MQRAWAVEFTDEFAAWWATIDGDAQDAVHAAVDALADKGTALRYPRSSDVRSSRHGAMRELRVQSRGRPLRVFYAFGPRRIAILLTGGDKTGDDLFYVRMVRIADRLFDDYLGELRDEES